MAEYIEREALLNALGFENAKRAQVQPVSTFEIILSASAADEWRGDAKWMNSYKPLILLMPLYCLR
ncbi:hypothetical protein [Agathobaculum desmolans]|uniref:hypothetical protein n=1 Tax=Agathobaculum desmolans TaxID=39484 RepID=UPI00248E3BB6|nr:hypothetical protein [Agathobaculum desmolans]